MVRFYLFEYFQEKKNQQTNTEQCTSITASTFLMHFSVFSMENLGDRKKVNFLACYFLFPSFSTMYKQNSNDLAGKWCFHEHDSIQCSCSGTIFPTINYCHWQYLLQDVENTQLKELVDGVG